MSEKKSRLSTFLDLIAHIIVVLLLMSSALLCAVAICYVSGTLIVLALGGMGFEQRLEHMSLLQSVVCFFSFGTIAVSLILVPIWAFHRVDNFYKVYNAR